MARGVAAFVAAAGALGVLVAASPTGRSPAGAEPAPCDLSRVDRARTPARRCLACHDGSISGKAITPRRAPGDGLHPVGVDYLAAWRRNPTGYAGALPPELPLVDGRIACTTCHDGAASSRAHVVVLTGGRDLCTACHRK